MKFVKVKEPVATTSIVEKVKFEEKPKMITQRVLTKAQNPAVRVLTKPPNPVGVTHKTKEKSLPKSQRGPKT